MVMVGPKKSNECKDSESLVSWVNKQAGCKLQPCHLHSCECGSDSPERLCAALELLDCQEMAVMHQQHWMILKEGKGGEGRIGEVRKGEGGKGGREGEGRGRGGEGRGGEGREGEGREGKGREGKGRGQTCRAPAHTLGLL